MPELDFTFLKEPRKQNPRSKGPRSRTLIGQTFGSLTPLGLLGVKGGDAVWLLQCSCCHQCVTAYAYELKRGTVKSCKRRESHGYGRTRIYRLWCDMHTRCYNPKFKQYADYGGRGIRIGERWHTFTNFLEDVGQPPSPKHQIERVNNNGNYEPGNVRWATQLEQAHNKRNNRMITAGGETLCLAEWATRSGLSGACITERLDKGETPEEAVGLVFKERKHQSRVFKSRHALSR